MTEWNRRLWRTYEKSPPAMRDAAVAWFKRWLGDPRPR